LPRGLVRLSGLRRREREGIEVMFRVSRLLGERDLIFVAVSSVVVFKRGEKCFVSATKVLIVYWCRRRGQTMATWRALWSMGMNM
jgi:hypothetical protein